MKRSIGKRIIAFIHISNFERRAVLVLLFVVLMVIAYRYFKMAQINEYSAFDRQRYLEVLDSLDQSSVQDTIALKPFNPNTMSSQELADCGLDAKLIKNIINYRTKIHAFKSLDEFSRLYALDDASFNRLSPFVVLPLMDEESSSSFQKKEKTDFYEPANTTSIKAVEVVSIELNTCTVDDLTRLKGIGQVFATRIIRYREVLGGFVDLQQLHEVYGLSDSVVAINLQYLALDTSSRTRIDLNEADFGTLVRHPYISKDQVKLILNYRRHHGPIKCARLTDIKGLEKDFWLKIRPYITCDMP